MEERKLADFTDAELEERRVQLTVTIEDLSIQQKIYDVELRKVDLEKYKREIASQSTSKTTK